MENFPSVNEAMWQVVDKKLSKPRMASYLKEANGDRALALKLYEWNTDFSSGLWQLLSPLEVGIRNSIDERLTIRNNRLKRKEHWIFDEFFELSRANSVKENQAQPFKDLAQAFARVEKNGKPMTPSQIISETSFGFWNQLVGKKHNFLWPDIAGAFPYAPSRDQKYVSTLFSDIRVIRNRISHHHKLHSETLVSGDLMILELAKALDPDFADWLASISRIPEIRQLRP